MISSEVLQVNLTAALKPVKAVLIGMQCCGFRIFWTTSVVLAMVLSATSLSLSGRSLALKNRGCCGTTQQYTGGIMIRANTMCWSNRWNGNGGGRTLIAVAGDHPTTSRRHMVASARCQCQLHTYAFVSRVPRQRGSYIHVHRSRRQLLNEIPLQTRPTGAVFEELIMKSPPLSLAGEMPTQAPPILHFRGHKRNRLVSVWSRTRSLANSVSADGEGGEETVRYSGDSGTTRSTTRAARDRSVLSPTAGRQVAEPGIVYFVATPIGNLEDITLRQAPFLCTYEYRASCTQKSREVHRSFQFEIYDLPLKRSVQEFSPQRIIRLQRVVPQSNY